MDWSIKIFLLLVSILLYFILNDLEEVSMGCDVYLI